MTVSALASMQVSAKVITFEELRAMADKGKPEVVDVMYSNRVPLGRPHVRLVTYIEDKLYLDGIVVGTTMAESGVDTQPWQCASGRERQ